MAWGNKWQVKFASNKTQLLTVSRPREPLPLVFDRKTLTSQEEVDILGVTYDRKLTFKSHNERLAKEASGKLASLSRMSWLLDSKGLHFSTRHNLTRPSYTRAWLGEVRHTKTSFSPTRSRVAQRG